MFQNKDDTYGTSSTLHYLQISMAVNLVAGSDNLLLLLTSRTPSFFCFLDN